MTSFAEKVLRIVSRIPEGRTLTYKEVAAKAGNPKAARAVGMILKTYDAEKMTVPCHRVVRSDGSPGGFRWGAGKKLELLQREAK